MNQPMSACSWVTDSSEKWNRGTVVRWPWESMVVPASGPVPVTTVPAASITAVTAVSSPASTRRSVRTGGGAGARPAAAQVERGRSGVQDHRAGQDDRGGQQEVRRHHRRVQLGQHDDPADHGLGDDPERQDRRQPDQVLTDPAACAGSTAGRR